MFCFDNTKRYFEKRIEDLTNSITKLEVQIKSLYTSIDKHDKTFSEHLITEEKKFDELILKLEQIQKVIWIAIGIAIVIQFFGIKALLKGLLQ